jgi:hypothetical protein
MTIHDIKSHLETMKDTIEYKGYCRVSVRFEIQTSCSFYLAISYHGSTEGWETNLTKSFFGADWAELYSQWIDYLSTMPTKAETDRQAYYKAVAKVVELGEKLQLETPMINPLREIMEKLASNALTHQTVLVDAEGTPLF